MVVVDASATLTAALARDLDRLLAEAPVAPPLMWSEATANLRRAVWRGELDPDAGNEALQRLHAAPIARRSSRRLYVEAWNVATRLGWARTYDAEYVALALMLDCRLVTLDGRVQRGAGHLVEIVGPADL